MVRGAVTGNLRLGRWRNAALLGRRLSCGPVSTADFAGAIRSSVVAYADDLVLDAMRSREDPIQEIGFLILQVGELAVNKQA